MARTATLDRSVALQQAMELFWARGYHRVSVDDIVQHTDFNRHNLYELFGSKYGLLKAVLHRYEESMLESIREVLAEDGTAKERIQRLLALRAAPTRTSRVSEYAVNGDASFEREMNGVHAAGQGEANVVHENGGGHATNGVHRERAAESSVSDDFWHDIRMRGCLALRVTAELRDSHAELAEDFTHLGTELEEMLADLLRKGQAAGEIRRDRTPEDLASVLVGGFLLPIVYAPAARRMDAFLRVLD